MVKFKAFFTGGDEGALCEIYKFWDDHEKLAESFLPESDCENEATYKIEQDRDTYWEVCTYHKNRFGDAGLLPAPLEVVSNV